MRLYVGNDNMRTGLTVTILMVLMCMSTSVYADFDIFGKVKEKAMGRAEQRTDEAIDKGLDAAEEAPAQTVQKKSKKSQSSDASEAEKTRQESGDKPDSDAPPAVPAKPEFKAYSKFDFVPGEQVLFFDDFASDNIGDFPARWNTNSGGEVVTLNQAAGRWLRMKQHAVYLPDIKGALPENVTVEFDIINRYKTQGSQSIPLYFIESIKDEPLDSLVPGKGGICLEFHTNSVEVFNWKDQSYGDVRNSVDDSTFEKNGKTPVHVSITIQKQRVRIYLGANKVVDVPRLVPAGLVMDRIRFMLDNDENEIETYITNFRVAATTPDLRGKLVTEGKLVVRGITFDTGSDSIKPESYGTMRQIGAILKEMPDLRVRIVGHTDSDGDAKTNLALSKRRAVAVKTMLASEFGIESGRMDTDGKGASEPVVPNTSSEGKAMNRRVEFVKVP